jgi:Flp pilus assembly pilin Flp
MRSVGELLMNVNLHSSTPSSQRGISAIEYLVLAVVVIGAIATAAGLFGSDISAAFTAIGDLINPP